MFHPAQQERAPRLEGTLLSRLFSPQLLDPPPNPAFARGPDHLRPVHRCAHVFLREEPEPGEGHIGRQRSSSGRWRGTSGGRGRHQASGLAHWAAEVVIRSVDWHIGRQRSSSGQWTGTLGGRGRQQIGGGAHWAAEVVIRSVEGHIGRQRSSSGRWTGTLGGRGRHQVGGGAHWAAEVVISDTEGGRGRYQLGGEEQRAAEVVIRSVELSISLAVLRTDRG